jgi:hypothetical protein
MIVRKRRFAVLPDYILGSGLALLLALALAGFFYWIFYDDTAADTVRAAARATPGMNVPK